MRVLLFWETSLMWTGHPSYDGYVGYGQGVRYYFQKHLQATTREELRNPLTEPELSRLTKEIQQGKHQVVVVTERELSNYQLIRIITAASKAESITTEIDASSNELDDNVVRDLVPILANNNKLKTLNLAYNGITTAAMPYFIQILKVNKKINCINLFQNQIDNPNLLSLQGLLNVNNLIEKERIEKEEIERVEIERELAKCEAYQDILNQLEQNGVVRDIAIHVLEYFNEAAAPRARQVVEDTLYPRVIPPQLGALELPLGAQIAGIHEQYKHFHMATTDSLNLKLSEGLLFSNVTIETRVVIDGRERVDNTQTEALLNTHETNTDKKKWHKKGCIIL